MVLPVRIIGHGAPSLMTGYLLGFSNLFGLAWFVVSVLYLLSRVIACYEMTPFRCVITPLFPLDVEVTVLHLLRNPSCTLVF